MITKPMGYDEAQSYTGDVEVLELGGHICVIRDAQMAQTQNGSQYIKLYIDIAEGKQKDFYIKRWEEARKTNANAKYGCVFTQFVYGSKGNSVPYFKGLIENIEASNPGFKLNWNDPNNESSLVGKLIGGVFGREEYKDTQGQKKMATRCVSLRSVDAIRKGVEIPEDKYLKADPFEANSSSMAPTSDDLLF